MRADQPAHLLVMDTNTTLSGPEPQLTIEALAEYLDVTVTTIGAGAQMARVPARSAWADESASR